MKKEITLLILLALFSFPAFGQLTLEGFNGTWTYQAGSGPGGPTDWAIVNAAGPVQTWNAANGSDAQPIFAGTGAAFIASENVTNNTVTDDWLITKQFTVPVNAELRFMSRLLVPGDQGTVYKIMMSSNVAPGQQTTIANYGNIQTWTELQINPDQDAWAEKVVNIPATYAVGSQVYLAFVMQGDAGDRWSIDNVQVISKCLDPTNLNATPSGTSAILTWLNPGNANSWEIEIVPQAGAPTGAGVVYNGLPPYTTTTLLNPVTAYKYYVRALCGGSNSAWVGPFNFTTSQIPAPLPFNENFEGTINWAINNGTQTNKWFVGTAVANSPTHSLYVSNNDGVSNAYTVNAASVVQAYRDIQMPTAVDQLNFSFDWKNTGETGWDYIRVWVVPSSFTPTVGTQITAAVDRIMIGQYVGSNVWNTVTTLINGAPYAGGTMRIVFEWRNDTTIGAQPPGAIDNVNLSLVTCPTPTALTLGTLTNTTANISWTAPTSVAPSYNYYWANTNTAPVAGTTPTGTVTATNFALTPLAPNTTYWFWVRSSCGGTNGNSTWVGPVSFTTPQVPATLPYAQNFDTAVPNNFTLNNGTATNKWVVGTATSNSPGSSLYVSNNTGTSNAYTINSTSVVHAYRDILIPAGAAEINVSFDWKNQGENNFDYIRVWVVPVTYNPVVNTLTTVALTGGTGVQVGGNFQLNGSAWTTHNGIVNVAAYQNQLRRVIFEWRNDGSGGTQPPGAIDNINISVVSCPQPITLTATNVNSTTAQLNWVNQGTAAQWEVYVVPTGTAAPTPATIGVTSNAVTYPAASLTPSTTYQFYVRAICGPADKSIWSGPVSFTTSIANNDCAGAMTLPVNPGENCVQSVQAIFTGATASPQPICTGVNGADIWYTFTATGPKHNIAVDFTGNSNGLLGTAQSISMSLYVGNVCTALDTSIYCVTNNYIVANNLVAGTVYTVRITINNATPNLATTFSICVTTPVVNPGDPEECAITTINNSFESPNLPTVAPGYPPIINQNAVQGWKTTAPDNMMEFWPVPNFENVPGYDGDQFVELNANVPSALYQDYVSPPGATFTYGFAHRGRAGTDVCQVKAGPPQGPWLPIGAPVSTGNTAWSYNTGTYIVPAGQTVTRFLFESVSTAATGPTGPSTGNFLDAVVFTANVGIITSSPLTLDCEDIAPTIQANGTGTWVAHSGNPAPTVIADDQSNTTTVTGFSIPGSYYYEWSTPLCSSTLEIVYQGGLVPAPTVADIAYCQNDVATPLTAIAEGTNELHWYTVPTGGTELAEAPTPSTVATGTTTYYVSQNLFYCVSPRAAITVTVNTLPAAPASTNVEYCQNAAATALTATADAGSALNWYTTASGGTALTAAPVPNTAVVGTTLYYVSQENTSGCESARTTVIVTINPLITPVTGFTLPATACAEGTLNPTQNAGFTTGGVYTAETGLTIDPSTGAIDLATSTPSTYNVVYTIAADPATCNVGGTTQATIVVNALITPNVSFSYTDVCQTAANQTPATFANFATGGVFTADPGLAINSATGEIDMANSTAGTYTVTYTYAGDAATCTAAGSDSAVIVITPSTIPVTEFNYTETYCFGVANPIPSFAANFTAGGTFTADNGLAINTATGEVNLANAAPGVYTVTYTVTADPANCEAGGIFTDTFSIGAEIAFTLEGDCEGNEYIITATSTLANGEFAAGSVFQWSTVSGAPVGVDSETFNVSQYAGSTSAVETFPMSFILTVSDGVCDNAVVFEVPDIACTIQRGVSPNNDDKNDTFDLTSMGISKLSIFNRYGKEVYSKTNYTNEWFGQTDGGEHLPSGTYFYSFERTNGEKKTGWIYVNWPE
jgi:gliding motility-associated-like protein